MTEAERQALFETLPVPAAVRRQITPAIISQMIALVYQLADTYFIGLLNLPAQTAAVTVAYPSFLMLTAISNLFGVGGASALSRALGRHEPQTAGEISSVSFWFGALAAGVYAAVYACLRVPILRVSGAADDTLPLALGYVRWVVLIGGVPTVLSVLLANLVRAEGRAKQASFGLSLGGLLNLVLDPLFVLPRFLDLGAAGAGMATALSNAVSMAYLLRVVLRSRSGTVLRLAPRLLCTAKAHLGGIVAIGFPSALQYALTVVAVSAQAKFVSAYPTQAVAALGITKKIDQLPLYFSIGVASGILPLLAYNHASGSTQRRRAVFRRGVGVSLGFSLLCLALYETFAPQLASVFIKDETTVAYAASFLRRMVTAMPLMSVAYPLIIQFQAMGRVRESLVCSVLRKGALDIPLLFLMDRLAPLYGLMWVQPIVDLISLTVAGLLYLQLCRKEAL